LQKAGALILYLSGAKKAVGNKTRAATTLDSQQALLFSALSAAAEGARME
jgi:hypothetical protein